MYSYRFLSIFLAFFVKFSHQLDCTQIPATDQVAGKTIYIPQNSQNPVTIPANFNCSYTISPPKLVYAQIIVTSALKGVDDVITIIDGQGMKTVINRNSPTSNTFYVFPQTLTTVTIDNQDPNSQCLVTIFYKNLPTITQNQLQKNQNLNYYTLTSLQLRPVTISSDEPITLTLGRSGHIIDTFIDYFVVDGPFDSFKSVHRLVDFQTSNFNSTGNTLSIVGFSNDTSFSTVIFTPLSAFQGFQKFSGIVANPTTGTISAKRTDDSKRAAIILAPNSQQLVLTSMTFSGTSSSCMAMATTGPPNSPGANTLIDFISEPFSLPQIFPFPYLSIVYQNCDFSFSFATTTPSGYYKTDQEKSGYIFSPSYLNLGVNSDFNVTFEYTGDDRKQFVVDVVDVTANRQAELDINIYDDDLKKTLSAVITGDQIGTRSRAFGKYLNVHMTGNGTAKLKWSLTSSSVSIYGFPTLILLVILMISRVY